MIVGLSVLESYRNGQTQPPPSPPTLFDIVKVWGDWVSAATQPSDEQFQWSVLVVKISCGQAKKNLKRLAVLVI